MTEPRVLLFDTENAPNLGYVWGKWEQNVIDFEQNWYFLSFAYKWLGQKKATVLSLPDFSKYRPESEDDKELVKALWEVLDQADVVIAHNGDKHDLRKANARFVAHGLTPPSPFKSVDTLKLARKHFQFDSNALDDLGKYLGVGRKLPHTGKHLWFGCMRGDEKSWATMRKYNAQDVHLLESVYLKLRPWATNHPDLTLPSSRALLHEDYDRADGCPICQSAEVEGHGWRHMVSGRRKRMLCRGCGHHFTCGPIIRREAA